MEARALDIDTSDLASGTLRRAARYSKSEYFFFFFMFSLLFGKVVTKFYLFMFLKVSIENPNGCEPGFQFQQNAKSSEESYEHGDESSETIKSLQQ